MSEFIETEILEYINSDVLNAIAEHDAAKKSYFELAAIIRNDLPSREEFSETLNGQASEVAYSFGEVALATYQAYGIDVSKETMTNLWFYEQAERINFMGTIVECTNAECHNDYNKDKIEELVEEFFSGSFDDDELLDNARQAYFDALESDAQSFVNHIESIRMYPTSVLSALLPYELRNRYSPDELHRKVAAFTGAILGISLGGAVVSKLLRKDHK